MRFENFNKTILFSCLISIFVVLSINYFIDPFDVFGVQHKLNIKKSQVDQNQRISKIPAFKLSKEKIDAIWIGSSRTGWNTNEKYEQSILNNNIKNMTLNSCELDEAITMAKNAVFIHPEIKTVYLGIDFPMFQKTVDGKDTFAPVKNKKITKEELLPLLLSFDTFENSLKTVSQNIKRKDKPEEEYGLGKEYNKNVLHKFENTIFTYYRDVYNNFDFDDKKIKELREFIAWAKEKGVNIIFFITSMHISERISIHNNGYTDDFYKFKEELAEIQPYYDFAVIDKYTTDVIRPEMQYFRDAIHTYSFLRKKVSRRLFGYEEDFGQLVTKDNVKQLSREDKKQLDEYIEQNPELVEQVKKWCE